MLFSSISFLFFFLTAIIVLYYAVPYKLKNTVLLLFSLFFYAWGGVKYAGIMLIAITLGYIFGLLIEKYRERKIAKVFVGLAVACIISFMLYFKYMDFFIDNFNKLLGTEIPLLKIVLPIGISFYTFQTMSYTLDIYMGTAKVQKNIASFGAYVTLFPQLIAGPIVRYQDVDDQLRCRPHNIDMFASGIRTFVCGLAKKILLANCAGELWDAFRAGTETDATIAGAWLGIIFYSFQLYFDFSGYSDMAIGLGKMMGFTFKENFFYPYISKSVTEFWRRWHISMGTWFREYVYIPLGGNRGKKWQMYRNIIVVWLLTGLWHGASWNYVLWGIYYCILLLIEKTFLLKLLKKLPAAVSHIYTLILVLFGWHLFVFEDMAAGMKHLGYMFGVGTVGFTEAGATFDLVRSIPFLAVLAIASTPLPKKLFYKFYSLGKAPRIIIAVGCLAVTVVCTAYLVDSSYNPFLYFRF